MITIWPNEQQYTMRIMRWRQHFILNKMRTHSPDVLTYFGVYIETNKKTTTNTNDSLEPDHAHDYGDYIGFDQTYNLSIAIEQYLKCAHVFFSYCGQWKTKYLIVNLEITCLENIYIKCTERGDALTRWVRESKREKLTPNAINSASIFESNDLAGLYFTWTTKFLFRVNRWKFFSHRKKIVITNWRKSD